MEKKNSSNQKKIAILFLDKVDFKVRRVIKYKEGLHNDKRFPQEDITILNNS